MPPPELDARALAEQWPGRELQIAQLKGLLGNHCDDFPNVLVYGPTATGKTTLVREVMERLQRPFAYVNTVDCRSSKLLFESVLEQLKGEERARGRGFGTSLPCDKLNEFVKLLPSVCPDDGRAAYIVVDGAERLRPLPAGTEYVFDEPRLLGGLMRLREEVDVNVGVILISKVGWSNFEHDTGVEGDTIPVRFPAYTQDEMLAVLPQHLEGSDGHLKASFLKAVMSVVGRKGKSLHELKAMLGGLYKEYRRLVTRGGVPRTDLKQLYTLILPHVQVALDEPMALLTPIQGRQQQQQGPGSGMRGGGGDGGLDFELPFSSKLLLLAAYITSRNPATLDSVIFEGAPSGAPLQGAGRKRRRADPQLHNRQADQAAEARLRGPGPFVLERMLAIYRCLADVVSQEDEDGAGEDEDEDEDGRGGGRGSALTADVLMQVSTLVSLKLLSLAGSDPLEVGRQYRCQVPDELAERVAKNVQLPLRHFLLYA